MYPFFPFSITLDLNTTTVSLECGFSSYLTWVSHLQWYCTVIGLICALLGSGAGKMRCFHVLIVPLLQLWDDGSRWSDMIREEELILQCVELA